MPGNWDDGADVRRFDDKLDGIKYVLKMMNQPHGDWTARKLHLVMPMSAETLKKRTRRNLRRHEARTKLFASMEKPPELMPGGPGPIVHVPLLSGFGEQQWSGAFKFNHVE
jgi:hypothetical protein